MVVSLRQGHPTGEVVMCTQRSLHVAGTCEMEHDRIPYLVEGQLVLLVGRSSQLALRGELFALDLPHPSGDRQQVGAGVVFRFRDSWVSLR